MDEQLTLPQLTLDEWITKASEHLDPMLCNGARLIVQMMGTDERFQLESDLNTAYAAIQDKDTDALQSILSKYPIMKACESMGIDFEKQMSAWMFVQPHG